MRIYYTEEGNVKIELTGIEDRIIWDKILKANKNNQVVFKKNRAEGTFTAYSLSGNVIDVDGELITLECDMDALRDFRRNNAKLGAVKYYKDTTGLPLKESKDVIDKVWAYLVD